MGYKELVLNLPPACREDDIRQAISDKLGFHEFSFHILKKSFDARKKQDLHWRIQVGVDSSRLRGPSPALAPVLSIPYKKGRGRVVVVGCGPAGFFSALVLQKAGYEVTLIERGTAVRDRASRIARFEQTGVFDPLGNYAFGEGGAGAFSDGKLTSRTKHITKEKNFVLSCYMEAGAPEEIGYLAHPHLGSDRLKTMVSTLTGQFRALGGVVLFETLLDDLVVRDGRVCAVSTSRGVLDADQVIVAPGHSAYDTYRMLIRRGVPFRLKNFALGSRVEHPQELINTAQWGRARLPGVKAAEYRLTSPGDGTLPVYTFCMCPGGMVVPATATAHTNIVNGMSLYARGGGYANAGCVVGVNIQNLLQREVTPLEALDWLESLEQSFHEQAGGFRAPACGIREFIEGRSKNTALTSSYPLGLKPADLWTLLPTPVSRALRAGLNDFSRTIRGFEDGVILGLESKTSSPIQMVRDETGHCAGFENLAVVGEGSGYAGGIVSSAVDGIKYALSILGD